MTEPHLRLVEDRPPSIPPPDPLIGRTLDGRYRVEAVLGEGGMGLVYKARHAVLNKPFAIKVLKPEVSRDQEVMNRFQQEAQSASAIGNHHIIDISDFGSLPDGSTYFVMEFLDGLSLTQAIEQFRPMPADRVIRVAKQLCDGLGAAHERNIVHRDLKPDNIYLVKRGQDPDFVKVLDFGIAKVGGSSSKLTKAGQVFGTPHYMSPEQCAGSQVDQRTDIYALGVILYEMCSGRVPFDADNLMGILTKHMYEQPIAPRDLPPPTDVPPGLDAVIMKCLSKSADARYQTMAEMREDLERVQGGLTPQAVVDAVDRASGGMRDATGRVTVTGRQSAIRIGAGDVPEAPSGRGKWIVAGVLGLGLVVAGVAGVMAMQGPSGGSGVTTTQLTPPVVPPVTPPETPPVVPPVENGSGPEVVTPVPTGNDTPPVAARAPVHLDTDPEGAEVLMPGGVVLGVTPLDVPRPTDGQVAQLTIRFRGYREETVGLTEFSPPTLTRTLVRQREGRGDTMQSMDVAAMEVPVAMDTPPTMMGSSGDGLVNPWDKP
jgi:serine/threonine-protein kinase